MGVCLGHQCIGQAYGGEVVVNYRMMRQNLIHHSRQKDLFKDIPSPYITTRYHSLVVKRESFRIALKSLRKGRREIMGLPGDLPIWGVQFHPESILTEHGHTMMQIF